MTSELFLHNATRYDLWQDASTSYQIQWQTLYEPYLVVSRKHAPKFHEAFLERYHNKMSHALEMAFAGFEFWVMPLSYVLHLPHVKHPESRKILKCAREALMNFVLSLQKKYGNIYDVSYDPNRPPQGWKFEKIS
ncbi:hypothetical protein CAPTEDRAFT_204188 [Capitella teleta]|uniref:Uncharacterized protein n=1 Tax=Capitella teleta TaxID=283909 RepID=R7UQV2_CAPTE|nr:hypothetical protein CAPTEDRAFT_204188 [Capitella teleta]|eukprot:ELU06317.1 hypothetical protein CAPTEDRAFT_204188 [Capitella teleta]